MDLLNSLRSIINGTGPNGRIRSIYALSSAIVTLAVFWMIGYSLIFRFIYCIGVSIIYAGYCICVLIDTILLYVLYPLGIVILCLLALAIFFLIGITIAGVIGAVGLLACGLYSCPEENTFDPWFKSFCANMIALENSSRPPSPPTTSPSTLSATSSGSTVTPTVTENQPVQLNIILFFNNQYSRMKSLCMELRDRLIARYGPSLLIKTLSAKMTVKYFNLGAFRLAFCSGIDSNGKNVIFVGAFNTWFPYR